jgi:hypothetical protein
LKIRKNDELWLSWAISCGQKKAEMLVCCLLSVDCAGKRFSFVTCNSPHSPAMPRELDEIKFISQLPRYTLRLSSLPTFNGLYDVTSDGKLC